MYDDRARLLPDARAQTMAKHTSRRTTRLVAVAILAAGCARSDPSAQVDASASAASAGPWPQAFEESVRTPRVVARRDKSPMEIAVAAGNVYLTEYADEDGTATDVVRVPLAGGEPVVLASRQRKARSLVAIEESLFWIVAGDPARRGSHEVVELPVSGGKPKHVGRASPSTGLAVGGTSLYFADGQREARIARRSLGGGVLEPVAEHGEEGIEAVSVDSARVFWVAPGRVDTGSIVAAPLGGGAVTELAHSVGFQTIAGIASDGAHLYFCDGGNAAANRRAAVRRVPVGGGTAETIATGFPRDGRPWRPAVDATHVYWLVTGTPPNGHALMRAPKAGGPVTVLVRGEAAYGYHLALDTSSVYWANPSDNVVLAISK